MVLLCELVLLLMCSSVESYDRIASLQYSQKHDRLLHSAPFRVLIGPNYDKYMEWGFVDGSVRFFATDSKKVK